MKKIILVVLMMGMFFTSQVQAGYKSGLKVERIRTHSSGFCSFGVDQSIAGTCSHYGEVFRFDTKTSLGKVLYTTLLAAKMANKPIVVWYQESIEPGTEQTTGCLDNTMAVVTGIGMP